MRTRITQQRATALRKTLTDSELHLWRCLRQRQIQNLKFRRQVPIGSYIVDFACLEIMLIVEVDGGQHRDSIYDARRDQYLREQGFKVLRFWDNEVLLETEAVLQAIYLEAERPVTPPS